MKVIASEDASQAMMWRHAGGFSNSLGPFFGHAGPSTEKTQSFEVKKALTTFLMLFLALELEDNWH